MFLHEEKKYRRQHLRVVVRQTQRMLFLLFITVVISLFLLQLFLLNKLASDSYTLTRIVKQQKQLSQTLEALDLKIAKIQTKTFVEKTVKSKYQYLVEESTQYYVKVPLRMTAKK